MGLEPLTCPEMVDQRPRMTMEIETWLSWPILFLALIVHSELKSVHSGFPVAFIF